MRFSATVPTTVARVAVTAAAMVTVRAAGTAAAMVAVAAVASGCLDQPGTDSDHDRIASVDLAVVSGVDGLAEAYAVWRASDAGRDPDRSTIGFGFHPGLGSERTSVAGQPLVGEVVLHFPSGTIDARLRNAPADQGFDLWLVKNGVDGSAAPDDGDDSRRIGTLAAGATSRSLRVGLGAGGAGIDFDFDLVVVTRAGYPPAAGAVAAGARTLFEKRQLRERTGQAAPAISGPLSDEVETTDPLVRRGAALFFDETFAGNGRTCGTCHRAENNLTIDAAFIATLPPSDPLFVAETVPELAELEDPAMLRDFGMIRENLDGFEDSGRFVLRTSQHTLAMSTSLGGGNLPGGAQVSSPPDQRTGWSGDGAPGRGTLNEFSFGAVVQHFPRTLDRRAGIDFRIPTQAELDALEAFQLFSGRQKNPRVDSITFADPRAEAGKGEFLGRGNCVACHQDMVGGRNVGFMVDTGVEALSRFMGFPVDGGMGVDDRGDGGFGGGQFNVPNLIEAADTGPFFHNGAVPRLEQAIFFYASDEFAASPGRAVNGAGFTLSQDQIDSLGAFLRVTNALENLRATRKRVEFVRDHRSPGNAQILAIAIEDCDDALRVLDVAVIDNPRARHAIATARLTLVIARANDDAQRPAFLTSALPWLGIARAALVISNPLNEF